MSFSCRTIWQNKMVQKCEFFVPHHFHGKKRFKKREFFVPHQIWQNKWFEKREFFARRHFAPRRRFKKTLSFSNLGRKMVSRTYVSRATTFSGIIWFNWMVPKTYVFRATRFWTVTKTTSFSNASFDNKRRAEKRSKWFKKREFFSQRHFA